MPLNRSNIGIAFTASRYKNFRAFAAMFAIPATYVSDEEDHDHVPTQSQNEQPIQITSPSSNEDPKRPSSEGATRFPSEGVTTDFNTDPHLIPQEPDAPLLASDQTLLMAYHEQLGHTSFAQLQELAKQGTIPKKLANVPPPKCPSCLYGKAHKRPWRTHKIDPKIKPTTVPGSWFCPNRKGKPTTSRFRGASVFADHASGFTYVHLHQALTTQETLDAKHAFERVAHQHAVRIMHYHCDNGRFADRAFLDDVRKAGQTITFCYVGAHQNGVAERRIRDITESACTMLLHAAHRWPKTITSNLWPQALKHATNVRNDLPRNGKTQSPISLFSNTTIEPNIKHFHPFGCPDYVLQAPLQTGAPFPKWNERSRVGIFLCHSPHHAASVPLILSTQMGLVSPQFHCVFDDRFETVKNEPNDTSLWQCKAHFTKLAQDKTNDLLISTPTHTQAPTPSLPPYASEIPAALLQLPDLPVPQTNNEPGQADNPESPVVPPATSDLPQAVPVDPMPPTAPSPTYPINIAPTGTTRTGRQVRTPSCFGYVAYLAKTALSGIADLHPLACLQMISGDINQPEGYPDAMPLDVALAQPDRDNFIGAMEKELKQHSELKYWRIVHRSQVPRNAKPIPMVWTLHRKRDQAGAIVKWKARLCAGGHRQVYGDTYWSTFAPVMSWTTVRCVFVLALLLGWHIRFIDFIMAYTQAKVKTDIYMTLPKATTIQNVDPSKHLLKLQQNLYGLKDGQVTWHEHIKKGLKERGFSPSKVDPCLFIKGSVLLVLYTDDAAFFSPSAQSIDDEISSLKKALA